MLRKSLLGLFMSTACLTGFAQVATGLYSYGSFDTPGFESIDRGSLNVHFSIPVLNKQGRGMNFQYALVYDGLIWTPAGTSGAQTWTPTNSTWGFSGQLGENLLGYMANQTITDTCQYQSDTGRTITVHGRRSSKFVYTDAFGRSHPLDYTIDTCINPNVDDGPFIISGTGIATDGSGYYMNLNGGGLTAPNGSSLTVPTNSISGAGTITDPNGNTITNNGNGTFTDTAGATALTISGGGTPSSPLVFTYTTTSGTAAVTIFYRTYTVQTAFGCSGVGEYNQTATLVDHITLADQSSYYFSYEPTPGDSSNVTGRLASVTLPQGGIVSYQYTGGSNGVSCADGTPTGITRSMSGGSRTYARSLITATTSQTNITDGVGNQSTFNFVEAGSPKEFYETQRSIYQGSATGTPLLSRQTCYDGTAPSCTPSVPALPINQIDTYETLDGIQTHGATTKFNAYGMQTEADVYDFGGASTRGNLLRKEVWTYGSSIVNLPTQDTVYDGSGNMAGDTVYGYDGTTPTASSGVPQHVAITGARGNLTSETVYASSGTQYGVSATYEDTGSLLTSTTPNGTTTLTYDPTFVYNTAGSLPTPPSGVALGYSATFDTTNTGLPLTSTDPNMQITRISSYDSMLRPTEIQYPDGGKTTLSYTPTQQSQYVYQSSSVYADTEIQYDSYGRLSRTAVANGQSGNSWYQADICYDANGNVVFSTYQYQGTGFAAGKMCSGSGDSYTYDVLGRLRTVMRANGETLSYTYLGRSTQTVDENGVTRISQIDGLGRPTIVCEISSNDSMPGSGSPVSCGTDIAGTGFSTTYSYTLATHTATITQGAQTRTFQTDWLGRTTSVTEPESGTTTYSYAYNSIGLQVTRRRPQANQTNASTLTTTTTQYDSLGRVTSIMYNDGTPTKTFAYDTGAGWSDLAQTNLKGRLSSASVPGAVTIYGYDAMGRITDLDECLPSGCGTAAYNKKLHYSYDWAGNLVTSTDGTPVQSTYSVSPANELLSLSSSRNNDMNPPNIISNVLNGANGPVSYSLGSSLSQSYSHDGLGRLNGGWVCEGIPSNGCSTRVYGFSVTRQGSQVKQVSDDVLAQGTTYAYDEFNRIATMTNSSGQLDYTYVYDRYGNRWQQNASWGGLQPQLSFNPATNQINIAGYTYDAAGNMTNDGFHAYTYDAEGNITQADGGSTAQYVYNASNQRVRTVVGATINEFVFNANGQHVSIWDGSTQTQLQGQYYWGGTPVAYYDIASGATHFRHQDWMGTERARSEYNGWLESTFFSLPFGDEQMTWDTNGAVNYASLDAFSYATLDHNSETNTERAQFRQYNNTQGRWMRPDPYAGSYDVGNPQSFNRYSYVLNNPLSSIDPSGLDASDNVPCPPRDAVAPRLGKLHPMDDPCVGIDPSPGPPETNAPPDCNSDSTVCVSSGPDPGPDPEPPPPVTVDPISFGGSGGGGAPNNGQEPPPACQAKILNATNNQFGTNYTNANVTNTFNYSTGAGPGQGTLNLNINGSTAGVSTGYYPVHWWTYAIGFGSTLHVVGGDVLDSPQTLQFGPNQGTFHIDSGFPYNPIGAFAHWLLNMTKAGGYPKC